LGIGKEFLEIHEKHLGKHGWQEGRLKNYIHENTVDCNMVEMAFMLGE
jgi:hypothetical protein